tara:strand:+ start:131 stop:358 length:228 start_codon:yes stop_codon:yes gene_type:complete
MKGSGRFFWQLSFIPKEMQQHINNTLKKAMAHKYPSAGAATELIEDFVKTSEVLLSGSNQSSEDGIPNNEKITKG